MGGVEAGWVLRMWAHELGWTDAVYGGARFA